MDEITPRQTEILAWICARMAEDRLPPTRAELMRAFAFRSPNAAESHLRVLTRKGYILLQSGTARGIRLCETGKEESGLPLIGRVAAGQPMLAEEFREGQLPVDSRLFSPKADYLLRVQGMSMRDAGIYPRSPSRNPAYSPGRADGSCSCQRRSDGQALEAGR